MQNMAQEFVCICCSPSSSPMQRLVIPPMCPVPFAKLIQRCWEEDPKQRITCKDILRDLEKMKEKGELQREYI